MISNVFIGCVFKEFLRFNVVSYDFIVAFCDFIIVIKIPLVFLSFFLFLEFHMISIDFPRCVRIV